MAIGMRAVAIGSAELDVDATMAGSREAPRGYRFERRGVPKARMFLQAEDVFGFSGRIIAQMKEFQNMAFVSESGVAYSAKGPPLENSLWCFPSPAFGSASWSA
jgi:hypothetical protein